jgi:ABC-type multidrug transport system ATPase subunit
MASRAQPRIPGSVELADCSRSFGSRVVLERCSLLAGPGDILALHGANGSGKTTAIRILAGVLAPDSGQALVCDAPAGRGSAAYVPAGDRMLHWRLTGEHDLRFYAALAGSTGEEAAALIEGAAEAVGASSLVGRTVGECSTGQRRRLMVAAALVTGAPVLLLDEPFSDLDREGREAVSSACRTWAESGGVVVYAAPEPGDGPPATQAFAVVGSTLERVT